MQVRKAEPAFFQCSLWSEKIKPAPWFDLLGSNPALPKLKFGELVLLASLEHRASISELLVQQGFQKNQHWVLFS